MYYQQLARLQVGLRQRPLFGLIEGGVKNDIYRQEHMRHGGWGVSDLVGQLIEVCD